MPLPGPYAHGPNVRYDVPLSNFAVEAWNDQLDGIAEQIFPAVSVDRQSGRYYVIPADAFMGVVDARRAPKAEPKRVEFQVSSDTFYMEEYALAAENDLRDLAVSENAIGLRRNSVRLVTGLLRRSEDYRAIQMVTSGSNVGSYTVCGSGAKWYDTVSSDIIGQVSSARSFIRGRTGFIPNMAVIDYDALELGRRNSRVIALVKGTDNGELTEDEFRERVLKVDNMVVAKSIMNTAKEGQSASFSSMWGDNLLMMYKGANTGLQSVTFGLRFQWQPPYYPANLGVLTKVENGAGERKVEVVECGHSETEKIVAKDLAYLVSDLL